MTPTPEQAKWLTQKLHRRFEVIWLDPSILNLDDSYQRTFRLPWGDEIVEKFDTEEVRPLHVVRRSDGSLYVDDGQHTLYALKQKGWKLVPAFVRNGPTALTEEAEHFIRAQTNSKSLRPLEMFHAEVTAERSMALDILAIVESLGLHVGHGKNGIGAVKALEKTYKASGFEGLRDVLDVIVTTWSEDEPQRLNAHIINGLTMFLRSNPNSVDKTRLIARLRTVVPDTLLARGRSIMQGAGSNSMAPALAAAIDKIYRKRKIEDVVT